MTTNNIELYSGQHAIEVEQFAIVFRNPIDSGDAGRFEENIENIKGFFAAVDDPDVFQFSVGPSTPTPPILKQLTEFGRDGKPSWSGHFGENAIAVASRRYTGWQEIWPQVQERLAVLLECVDPFKSVGSIEFSVTDNLREGLPKDNSKPHLLSRNIFRKGTWVPDHLLDYEDPRWDFDGGKFIESNSETEELERLEAKGVIQGGYVVATLCNTFSLRFKKNIKLRDLFDDGKIEGKTLETFERFHDLNKETIKTVLVDPLLERMGLE